MRAANVAIGRYANVTAHVAMAKAAMRVPIRMGYWVMALVFLEAFLLSGRSAGAPLPVKICLVRVPLLG